MMIGKQLGQDKLIAALEQIFRDSTYLGFDPLTFWSLLADRLVVQTTFCFYLFGLELVATDLSGNTLMQSLTSTSSWSWKSP